MLKVPFKYQEPFFRFLQEELPIVEFEEWLYNNDALENVLGEKYIELISLDFNDYNIFQKVKKIMSPMLNYGEFEKCEIEYILDKITLLDDNFPAYLLIIYHIQNPIMEKLQLITYGLGFEVGICYDKEWNSYSQIKRIEMVANFYENIKEEVDMIKKQIAEFKFDKEFIEFEFPKVPRNKNVC